MPKVTGPFFSLAASKLFGKTIEYRTDKSKTVVSIKHKPGSKQPFDLGVYQKNARVYIAEAVDKWHTLTPEEKKQWDDFVKS